MDDTVSFELLQKREELRDEIRKLETEKEITDLLLKKVKLEYVRLETKINLGERVSALELATAV